MLTGTSTEHRSISNAGVTNSVYTNTSASAGTWKVNATATNANGMVSREWTWNVTSPASTGKPNITGYAPVSPVNDISGALRSFNITLNQTANVNWYINGTPVLFNAGVTNSVYTNTSAMAGTWIVNATAANSYGTSNTITWIVTVNELPLSSPCTTCGSSSGGGGGGGGGSSGENYSNIVVIEKYDLNIYKDKVTSYRFTDNSNPILFVNITGNISTSEITTSVEVLRNTSTLMNISPEGVVYKNVNIWVGTFGFATPKNIKEARVIFKVDNSWISSNKFENSDIKIVRWDGSKWIILETNVKDKDSTTTYFEANTNRFSHFAITGFQETPVIKQISPTAIEHNQAVSEIPKIAEASKDISWKMNLEIIIAMLLGLFGIVYLGKGIL